MWASAYDDYVAACISSDYKGRLRFEDIVHIFSYSLKLGRTDIWRQALYISRWFTLSEDKHLKDYDLSKHGLDVNAMRKFVRVHPAEVVGSRWPISILSLTCTRSESTTGCLTSTDQITSRVARSKAQRGPKREAKERLQGVRREEGYGRYAVAVIPGDTRSQETSRRTCSHNHRLYSSIARMSVLLSSEGHRIPL